MTHTKAMHNTHISAPIPPSHSPGNFLFYVLSHTCFIHFIFIFRPKMLLEKSDVYKYASVVLFTKFLC